MRKNRIGLRTQINQRGKPSGPRETRDERARRLYDADTERMLKEKRE